MTLLPVIADIMSQRLCNCRWSSGWAAAAGQLGSGHRVGGVCAVLPADGRRWGGV